MPNQGGEQHRRTNILQPGNANVVRGACDLVELTSPAERLRVHAQLQGLMILLSCGVAHDAHFGSHESAF